MIFGTPTGTMGIYIGRCVYVDHDNDVIPENA